MISYVSVLALLIGVAIGSSGAVPFTAPNATFVAIAEELGIQRGVRGVQFNSPLYGGSEGITFDTGLVGPVAAIHIRSDKMIDSIHLVFQNGQTSGYYGGNGGILQPSIFLTNLEHVETIMGRNGSKIDSLTFVTNAGRIFGPYGGKGGKPFQVEHCNLKGIFGRNGSTVNAIGFHC